MNRDDHEKQEREREARARSAQAGAAQAYARLMAVAEDRDDEQIRGVASFLASTFNGEAFPFDPFELRTVDIEISDDMLVCLDALRWGEANLHELVYDGERRLLSALAKWEISWPRQV